MKIKLGLGELNMESVARYCSGELYDYNNGKPEKIDDDVIALIPVVSARIRGDY